MNVFTQIVNAPFLYVNGLITKWLTRSSFNVMPGICRDSTNSFDMIFNELISVDLNKKGIGGLDNGVLLPNQSYSIYAIGGIENNILPSAIATLSTNILPSLPTIYEVYRRIGYFTTRGDSLVNTYTMCGNNAEKTINLDAVVTYSQQPAGDWTTLPLNVGLPQIPGINAIISTIVISNDTYPVAVSIVGIRTTGLVDTSAAQENAYFVQNSYVTQGGIPPPFYITTQAQSYVITGGDTIPSVDYKSNTQSQVRICGWLDSL
jgi:hypothetical protein